MSESDTPDKVQRWLDLIAFLVGRRFPVSHDQLVEGVAGYRIDLERGVDPESLRRKFERDKRELRELGIPLESVPFSVDGQESTGYRLRGKDFYLPYLRLLERATPGSSQGPGRAQAAAGHCEIAPEELAPAVEGLQALAELASFPLRREARAAMSKLTFDLGDEVPLGPAPVLAAADPPVVRERVGTLTDATARRKRVRFTYEAPDGKGPRERTVEPWGLIFKFNRWYLVGLDHDRDAPRTFRVARMSSLAPESGRPGTPDFERPELDLAAWAGRDAWDLPGAETPAREADVHFAFPLSLWAERNGKGEPQGPPDASGGQVRRFQVRHDGPFLRWLLTFEGEATPLSPDDLRDGFRSLADSVVSLYASDDP